MSDMNVKYKCQIQMLDINVRFSPWWGYSSK